MDTTMKEEVKEEELDPSDDEASDSTLPLNNVNESSTQGNGSNMQSGISANGANLTAGATTSSSVGGKEERPSTSTAPGSSLSGNKFGPALKLYPNPLIRKVVEVIDLTSDLETEDLDASSEQSRNKRKRQAIPSRATRSSTLKRKQIQDNSSSDEEEESRKKPEKRPKVLTDAKKISNARTVNAIMRKHKKRSNIIKEYRKIIIEQIVTNTAMMPFFKKYGNQVDEIEIMTWIWKSVSVPANIEDPIDLAKLLMTHCKNLSSLTLGPISPAHLHSFDGVTLELKNLSFLSFDIGSLALDQDGRNGFEKMLTTILQATDNLEALHGKMSTREDFLGILNAMKTSLTLRALQNLEVLNLASIAKVPVLLQEQDIHCISDMKLKLKSLVLGFGLWGNITTLAFFGMLSSPRLEEINIQGSFEGELNAKTICLDIPPLINLTKLSIGGEYSFSRFSSGTDTNTSVSKNTEITIEGNEKRMPNVEFKLPMLPNLESIRLGSLCYIDRLSPNYFPKLKSLRIGGPWNLSFDFLKDDIVFQTVTDLQFPDGLKDTSFSARIPSIFPNLKNVWVFLPSGRALQSFIMALEEQGHLQRVQLCLKTQFDFESTFRACALKRKPGVDVKIKPYEKQIIAAINRYKYKDEFMACYNIELPEEESSTKDKLGYPGLRPSQIWYFRHASRIIRIPEGKYYWYDQRCKFTDYVIGCDKDKKRLDWYCMKEDFPLVAKKSSSVSKSGPKVRIQPSAVRLAQFVSKPENA